MREESYRLQKSLRTIDDIEHDKRLRMHLEILMKENKLDMLKKFNVIGFYVMGIGVQFFFFLNFSKEEKCLSNRITWNKSSEGKLLEDMNCLVIFKGYLPKQILSTRNFWPATRLIISCFVKGSKKAFSSSFHGKRSGWGCQAIGSLEGSWCRWYPNSILPKLLEYNRYLCC